MLYTIVLLMTPALIAALLGFYATAAMLFAVAKVVFVLFLLLFIVSLIAGMPRRR